MRLNFSIKLWLILHRLKPGKKNLNVFFFIVPSATVLNRMQTYSTQRLKLYVLKCTTDNTFHFSEQIKTLEIEKLH